MLSILDNSTLDDFIITAEMEETEAKVVRVHQNDAFLIQPSQHQNVQSLR
jgi:hypothetical protein